MTPCSWLFLLHLLDGWRGGEVGDWSEKQEVGGRLECRRRSDGRNYLQTDGTIVAEQHVPERRICEYKPTAWAFPLLYLHGTSGYSLYPVSSFTSFHWNLWIPVAWKFTYMHTHTQPCNGPLSGSTWVGWYQKKDSPTRTHPVHQSYPYQIVLDWVRHFRPIPIRFFDTASRADLAPRDWQIKGSRHRRRN